MTACSSFPNLKELSFCQLRGSTGTKGGSQEGIWDRKRRTKKRSGGGGVTLSENLTKTTWSLSCFHVCQTTENSLSAYPFQQGKLSQMGNNNINKKSFSIYHLFSLVYLIVSLLDKIKLCMAGSRGCNQTALINLINSTNKTDLKNGSIKWKSSQCSWTMGLWPYGLKAEQTCHVHQWSLTNPWPFGEVYKYSNGAATISHSTCESIQSHIIRGNVEQSQVHHPGRCLQRDFQSFMQPC